VPGFGGRPGRAIPDGQGGVLLAQGRARYRASASGVTKVTLPMDAAIPFYNTPLLVGEDGTAYLVASSYYTSPNDTILAVDPASGTIQWSVNTNRANLNLVTTDGKVVFEYSQPDFTRHVAVADATGQVSPVLSMAGSPDPAIRGYTFSNPDYWDSGSWNVPMPDGNLKAIQGEERAASDMDTYAAAGGDKQKKYQEPKGVKFLPDPQSTNALSQQCTGFDDTLKPRGLMVPLLAGGAPGSNTALVRVKRGWENLLLKSLDTNVADVFPSQITSPTLDSKGRAIIPLTVPGKTEQVVHVIAVDSLDQTKVKARLKVVVKPRKEFVLNLFKITESSTGVGPSNAPSDAVAVQQFLNAVYGKQTNIFSRLPDPPVEPIRSFSFHFDLDNDHALLLGSSNTNPETRAIFDGLNAQIGTRPFDHKWINYVSRAIDKRAPTRILGGFADLAGVFVADAGDDAAWKTAHELGHNLADVKNSGRKQDLMYEWYQPESCRIRREQWKFYNPSLKDTKDDKW
jgi:hypothetical protein